MRRGLLRKLQQGPFYLSPCARCDEIRLVKLRCVGCSLMVASSAAPLCDDFFRLMRTYGGHLVESWIKHERVPPNCWLS